MQLDELVLIQAGTGVPAREHERDRHSAPPAPLEDHSLALGEDVHGDALQPADRTALEGIHPGVVKAQVELEPIRVGFPEHRAYGTEVLRRVPDDADPGARGAVVVVHATDRDIDLGNARHIRDEGCRPSAAMCVEIEDQHGPGAGANRCLRRDDQAVERAESRTLLAAGVVQAARQRPGDSVLERGQRSGDHTAIRREHHRPEARVPCKTLRLGEAARLPGLDGPDVPRLVHFNHLGPAQWPRLHQPDAGNRHGNQRIGDPPGLPRRVEREARSDVLRAEEDFHHPVDSIVW